MGKTIKILVALAIIIIIIIVSKGNKKDDNNDVPLVDPASEQTTTTTTSTTETITIQGHKIPQGTIEIEAGTKVVWTNKDNLAGLPYDKHTITSGTIDSTGENGVAGVVPNSGNGVSDGTYQQGLALNESYDYTFTEAGEYPFYIAEHPLVSGQGQIIVTQKSTAAVINMESGGFFYTPSTLQAKVGEEVNLAIASAGDHTFTIDELGVDIITPNGETTLVSFTPDKAGTFQFYCAVPGHREAGQVGTITIQ